MECVIDFKVLHGEQNDEVVKEFSVTAENVIETFNFKSPYPMSAHGSDEMACLAPMANSNMPSSVTPYATRFQDTRVCTRMAPQKPDFSQTCWGNLYEI